jgi:hypothetical protein
MSRYNNVSGLGILLWCLILIVAITGYVNNIVKLTKTDFASPYKAEVLRTTGVFLPPVGVIMGYCNINDEQQQQLIKD